MRLGDCPTFAMRRALWRFVVDGWEAVLSPSGLR
jgi:hypothetical protein